jgi:hypothetical protein
VVLTGEITMKNYIWARVGMTGFINNDEIEEFKENPKKWMIDNIDRFGLCGETYFPNTGEELNEAIYTDMIDDEICFDI